MNEIVVVSGSASINFGINLAKGLGSRLAVVEASRYPDGECYVRIPDDLTGDTVVLVQTTYPDECIIELFLTVDAVREFDIERLILVVPYFGYARQDKKFKSGEAVSARALTRHLQIGVDTFLTVDIHEEKILGMFEIPARNITAMREIGAFLSPLQPDLVLAPDQGAVELARIAADELGCSWDYLEKTRLNGSNVVMKPKNLQVKDLNVAIVDDIISTGGTIATAAEQLRDQGATKIFAACTHGLFAKDGLDRVKSICTGVFATDTIKNSARALSAAPAIVEALRSELS